MSQIGKNAVQAADQIKAELARKIDMLTTSEHAARSELQKQSMNLEVGSWAAD